MYNPNSFEEPAIYLDTNNFPSVVSSSIGYQEEELEGFHGYFEIISRENTQMEPDTYLTCFE